MPARILTFGDESNMLSGAQGLKYSINGLSATTGNIDCSVNPLWTQILSASYNLSYANCNTQEVASPLAFDFSTLNATVDDTTKQVAAFQAGDAFQGNDLVTIWVGVHDVLDEYQTNGSGDDATSLVNAMRGNGAALASLVNSIVATGAKVILLTVQDIGDSPYANTENQRGDFDRGALLSQMVAGFNNSLRSNIVNDGSKIGLVLVDDIVHNAVRSPSSYGLVASSEFTAGCVALAPLPTCTNDTLVTDAATNKNAASIWLWADATHLAPTAHTQIGNSAVSRAHANPF